MSTVMASRFPSTNNQIRTSSNLRNQATIQDGRVTVQQVQGRYGQCFADTGTKGNATSHGENNAAGQAMVVKCYNFQGEGHMARECTQPKRPMNSAWFKEKMLLVQAQKSGQTPPAPQDEDEHEPMFIQPHDPDFVPEPIYLEYIPLEDEHTLPTEEQPLPPDGPVDYPMDGGDDGNDDDGESLGDDAKDEDEDEEEEEEEHLAPTDSTVVIPTDELVSPLEGTEPVIPHPPLTLLPLELGLPSDFRLLFPFYQRKRCTTSAALPSLPLPPPLHMPPPIDRKDDISEIEMPPRKRLCLSTLGSSTLDVEARRRGIGEDMIAHKETIQIVEDEAYAAREAWAHSIRLSQAVLSELQTHQEQTEIAELQETDRRHQAQMAETLRVMGDIRREMGNMQAELLALRGQPRRAGQPWGDVRVPNHQDAPRDADKLSPTSYLDPRVDKHNLLRGGISISEISSLRSIGGGMCRGGGNGSDGNAAGVVHLSRRSPAEGGDSEVSGDGDGVGMARSLSTSSSDGMEIEA
nr:hypothetical protein [Tanacetum cinerariifolium]